MRGKISKLTAAILAIFVMIPLRSALGEPLRIYAAGSLTAAFTDMVRAFPAAAGAVAIPVFGPSGVLRERIERGVHVDVSRPPTWTNRAGWHARTADRWWRCSLGIGYAHWEEQALA